MSLRFTVLEKLADGAAVELFLGRADDTGEYLLLEALRAELQHEPDILRRLEREARLRESLEHPHVTRRVKTLRTGSGRPFWMSAPMTGETLRHSLRTHPTRTVEEVIRTLVPLCEAVAYLHAHGLTHGNISPEYVLLESTSGQVQPKLIDSGLSLLRIPEAVLAAPPSSRVIVKPEYLSPERIQGTRAQHASDIYSLGILMFELLSGRAPYHDADHTLTRRRHLTAPLPELPTQARPLEGIVCRCLAKNPSARFESAQELRGALLDALGRLRASRSPVVGAPEPGWSPRRAAEILAAAATPAPLPVLQHYEVLRRLGEGATGQVYLARHRRIDRLVAIKMLRPEHARNAEMVARFVREARAANRVHHEHIAEVYDCVDEVGPDGVPRVYLVMEYLEGAPLGKALQSEPLSLARAVGIVRQLCAALSTLHQAGVVHRDIKPDNVFLVQRPGRQDFVKLVDFGIAKLAIHAEVEAELTSHGEVLGTPSYMAPEQLSAKDADARADVYALGTVLYRMLCGRTPFSGRTVAAVLVQLIREPAPPLPETTVSGEALPPELAAVVMRCLEKAPERRPSTMRELDQLLAPFSVSVVTDDEILGEGPSLVGGWDPAASPAAAVCAPERSPASRSSPEDSLGDGATHLRKTPVPHVPETPPASRTTRLDGRYFARRAVPALARAEPGRVVLFVTTDTRLPIGTRVEVHVSFGDCPETFRLRGLVVSPLQAIGRVELRGLYVAFEHEERAKAVELLAFCVRRQPRRA